MTGPMIAKKVWVRDRAGGGQPSALRPARAVGAVLLSGVCARRSSRRPQGAGRRVLLKADAADEIEFLVNAHRVARCFVNVPL